MISPQKHCDHECVCMGYSHREESIDDLPCPKDPCIYRSLPAPVTTLTILSSEELILLAENDWHNREERKHLHPKIPWVSGWITGFLSMSKLNWSAQHDTRSRPAPSPKTWESCMEHVTCPNGEECWYLSEDFHNEEKAAIAVKARNQTLNDVRAALSHIRFQDEDAWFIEATIKKIESLRTEAPIPQHNRGEQR